MEAIIECSDTDFVTVSVSGGKLQHCISVTVVIDGYKITLNTHTFAIIDMKIVNYPGNNVQQSQWDEMYSTAARYVESIKLYEG